MIDIKVSVHAQLDDYGKGDTYEFDCFIFKNTAA